MNVLTFASAILLYCVVLGGLFMLLENGTSDMASLKKGVLTRPPCNNDVTKLPDLMSGCLRYARQLCQWSWKFLRHDRERGCSPIQAESFDYV